MLPEDRLNLFPEFSAQVAGYVQSPRRRDGLHVMVDVGGGTLDVAVFNIHEHQGQLLFPVFARKVRPLGTRYLMKSRSNKLPKILPGGISPFDDLPNEEVFCKKFGLSEAELESVDAQFRKSVEDVVVEQLRFTKVRRVPKAPQWFPSSPRAPEYGQGLPSFFCGGGALSTFYSSLLNGFERKDTALKLKPLKLPAPEDIEPAYLAASEYERLNVAYGLSLDPFDIGKIKRMSDVPDAPLTATESGVRDRYVSKDHV